MGAIIPEWLWWAWMPWCQVLNSGKRTLDGMKFNWKLSLLELMDHSWLFVVQLSDCTAGLENSGRIMLGHLEARAQCNLPTCLQNIILKGNCTIVIVFFFLGLL
jgi:hypothetical protein